MKSPHLLTRREVATARAAAAVASAGVSPGLFAQGEGERRFKIIGFTKPFQNLNFEDTAKTVAEIGWDGIECPVRPKSQIKPERAPDELPGPVEAPKKQAKELTIITTTITTVSNPHTKQHLRTTAKPGI